MQIGIGGYSFHRLMESGQQDIFGYIETCRALGATQLDPWNEQFASLSAGDAQVAAGVDPESCSLNAEERAYVTAIRDAARAAGLPFGCIAVDGAHIYEPTPQARHANAGRANRWLEVAAMLEAPQLRIDSGGPEDGFPDEVFNIVVEGYKPLIAKARRINIEILIENHWGPSRFPENTARMLNAVEGLGLLFDTGNWEPGFAEEGLRTCARHARATHIKTFVVYPDTEGPEAFNPRAIRTLRDAGYSGCWGVESCPETGDEYEAAKAAIALIRKTLAE